jgi:hypothetical protein
MLCLPSAAALVGAGSAHAQITGQSDDWYVDEEFDGYSSTGTCESGGVTFGAWLSNFAGTGGCTEINSSQQLVTGGSVNAALVTSTLYEGDPVAGNGDIYVEAKLKTTNQYGNSGLSCSSGGIYPYQVGWITWNGHFDSTCDSNGCYVFNYFMVKPRSAVLLAAMSSAWCTTTAVRMRNAFSRRAEAATPSTRYTTSRFTMLTARRTARETTSVAVNGTTVMNGYVDNTCSSGPCMFGGGWTVGAYEQAATVVWSYLYGTRL